MFLSRVSVCILVLTCAAITGCDNKSTSDSAPAQKIPPDVASLISKADQLNDKCRGGSGDDPATSKACDARDAVIGQIRAKKYCFGTDQQIQAEKTWQECAPASAVATQAGRSINDPSDLHGAWRCTTANIGNGGYLEYDFDSQKTEFLLYGASGSLNLIEPLNYGHYRVNGNKINIHWEASKFVRNVPADATQLRQWRINSKKADVTRSYYATYEYNVVTHTRDKLVMKPIRKVNWDGIDSENRASWPVESCTSTRATYPLAEIANTIPYDMRALKW